MQSEILVTCSVGLALVKLRGIAYEKTTRIMTSQPPSSSDGPVLPPRIRPLLASLAKETTEQDLWAFDGDPDSPQVPEEMRDEMPLLRIYGKDLPEQRPRQSERTYATESARAFSQTLEEDKIRTNIQKSSAAAPASPAPTKASAPENIFDDLESWDAGLAPPPFDPPLAPDMAMPAELAPPQTVPLETAPAIVVEPDEFSPAPPAGGGPVSLRPRLRFSKVERFGVFALLVCLFVALAAIFGVGWKYLPTASNPVSANDFPIKGSHVTLRSATSYWRAPIAGGASPDTFRRGTQLLPVLELDVSGGPAVLRILFRNDDRSVVGDAVTRTVANGGLLQIPATAGFDDLGMHAAYRTGESKPWTIEVLEAPTATAAGKEFKPIFEMNISTDRR